MPTLVGEDLLTQPSQQSPDIDVDITSLATKFFPDLSLLDEQDICPSLKTFDLGNANGSLDLPFLKAPENWRGDMDRPDEEEELEKSGLFLDDGNAAGFDEDEDDGGLGGFDLPAGVGFGEGGEAWAKEAALEPQMRVHHVETDIVNGDDEEGVEEVGTFRTGSDQYAVTLTQGKDDDHENILNYFDQALHKSWAGPEHWRIRRIRDSTKSSTPAPTKRKEKEPFEIDFAAPMPQSLADALYTPATSSSAVLLPKTQWKSKTRNLLPDDKHFNSKQLLRLFLKPKARVGSRKPGQATQSARLEEVPKCGVDETFWARNENTHAASPDEEAPQGNYNADFFHDDGLGAPGPMDDDDDVFADARENFSPPLESEEGIPVTADVLVASQEGAFGAQLVTQSRRLRPEYVQYARVAKKVDVRRLKEEMWRGIGFGVRPCTTCLQYNRLTQCTGHAAPDSIGTGSCIDRKDCRRLSEVYRRDEQPTDCISKAGHGGHLDFLLLHLFVTFGEREGASDKQRGRLPRSIHK